MQYQTTRAARNNAHTLRSNMTDAERSLWSQLRQQQLGVKFRRQHPFGPYVADFVCLGPKLVVEIDGSHHLQQVDADLRREAFFSAHGFPTLRFWSNEIFQNMDGVVERIFEAIQRAPSLTLPQRGKESQDDIFSGETSGGAAGDRP